MTDFNKILEKAKELEAKVKESQEKIKNIKVEGSSGGGIIKVLVNGKNEIKSLKIDPTLIKAEEVEVLEDLLIAAINDANKKLKESAANQMSSLSDGIGLPPGMKLPF